MATSPSAYLRSPFENVLHILPQGHDKALKQAFYNTGATLFIAIVLAVCLAVYYILQFFIKPIIWALLCGSFLYPFKKTLFDIVGKWLNGMKISGTPILVGTTLVPFQLADLISETFGAFLVEKWKILISIIFTLCSVYILYHFGPLQSIISWLQYFIYTFYYILGYFNHPYIIWSLVACYIIVILFFWSEETRFVLKKLSIPIWIIMIFHLASASGTIRISLPLIVIIASLMLIGFVTEIRTSSTGSSGDEHDGGFDLTKTLSSIGILPEPKETEQSSDSIDSSDKVKPIRKKKKVPTATLR